MESLSQIMNKWRGEGYSADIHVDKHYNAVVDGKELDKSKLQIDKQKRFEGESNPSDMSILFAISQEGKKLGLIVDTFNPKEESDTSVFLKDVQYAR